MSAAANNVFNRAGNIRTLRLGGDLGASLRAATTAMTARPGDLDVMGEAIRTLILCNQAATALQLYLVYSGPEGGNRNLEPAALVRLALQIGRTDLLNGMPVPVEPAWLATLLTTGEEPTIELVLRDMKLTAADGPSVYLFEGDCPYCGHPAAAQLKTNLLVRVTHFCPACFGQYAVDYQGVRAFLQTKYGDYLNLDVSTAEWDLIDHVRPRLMLPDGAPDIVRALGQDYHFLLNEILARHLLADPTVAGEVVS